MLPPRRWKALAADLSYSSERCRRVRRRHDRRERRNRVKGSVTQRSPGAWTLRFDAGRDASGKRKQKVATFRGTKREAERELTRLLNDVHSGTFIEPNR